MWVSVVVCPRLLPCRLHFTAYIWPSTETLITDSCFLLSSSALSLRLFSCFHLFRGAGFGSSGQIYNLSSHSCPAALFVHGHVSPSSSLWIDVVKKILQVRKYWLPSHCTLSWLWFLSASSAVMGSANMCLAASGRFSSWDYFSPPLCHVSWHVGDLGFPTPVCPSSSQFAHSNMMEVVLPSAELPEPSSGVFQYQPFVWTFL